MISLVDLSGSSNLEAKVRSKRFGVTALSTRLSDVTSVSERECFSHQ